MDADFRVLVEYACAECNGTGRVPAQIPGMVGATATGTVSCKVCLDARGHSSGRIQAMMPIAELKNLLNES